MALARCELLFLLVNLSCVLWALLGISFSAACCETEFVVRFDLIYIYRLAKILHDYYFYLTAPFGML